MKKKLLPTLVAAIAAAYGTGVQASVLFDFGQGQIVNVGAFDWSQTTFVAQNGNQAVANRAATPVGTDCSGGDCDFTIYTHAYLTGVKDVDGNNVNITGLNSTFEITTQFSFNETVTGVTGVPGQTGALAAFATNPGMGEFVEIFYDANPNVNDLQGFGFNDGTLILTGSLVDTSSGLFAVTDDNPIQFDQFPTDGAAGDNYGDGSGVLGDSQLTVEGFGSQDTLEYDTLHQDDNYFKSQLDTFGISFDNISIGLPINSVNPSDCFATHTTVGGLGTVVANGNGECAAVHVDGLYVDQLVDPNGGYLPVTGNINGGPIGGGGGPDFVAQTDYNQFFNSAAVPEPLSLGLFGVGLVGLGFARSRKQPTA